MIETRKLWIVGIIMFFLLIGCGGQIIEAEDTTAKKKVAVVNFEGDVAQEYKKAATNILVQTLHDFGRFRVLDRSEVGKVLEEQKLQQSGLTDQSTAAEIGKLVSANLIVTGTVNNVSVERQDTDVGDYYDAGASVTVKFIDVETGELEHTINNDLTISESNREAAKQQVLKDCFGHSFLVKLREKYSLYSRITKVDGKTVYFANGQELGVKEESRYQILAEEAGSQEMDLEPEDKLWKKIGVIEVTKVAGGVSKGRIIWNSEEVKAGNLIKEMVSISNNQFKLDISRRTVTLTEDGYDDNRGTLLVKLHHGWETPYNSESSFYGGLNIVGGVSTFDVGYQLGKEFPISQGDTYFSLKGNAGLAMARQDTGFILLNLLDFDNFMSPYVGGSAGLKIYTNHKVGMRLGVGVNYQLGPSFSWVWAKEYEKINYSGLGLYGTVTFPFGRAEGKEKEMEFKDIDENVKKANQMLETVDDIMDIF